jgi:flagellar assembly protein FliH
MIASEHAFTPLVVPRVGQKPTDARADADRARVRGYADGFAEGRRIALEEARAAQMDERVRMQALRQAYLDQRESALTALRGAQSSMDRRVDELAASAVDRIEELALALAETIVGVEMSDPARSAAHAVRRALDEMPADRWTRISFSERDAAALREDDGALASLGRIEMVASPSVDPGGAVVEIEDGAVDTRISHAFSRASAAWRGVETASGPISEGSRG